LLKNVAVNKESSIFWAVLYAVKAWKSCSTW